LAETGIIGFLVELIIIITLFRYLYLALSKAKTLEDKNWYFILVGLASAYFVILGSNITYHFYTQFYVWFFMGLIVATSRYVLDHVSIRKIKNN
jgi:O-antigen ligase